MSRVVVAEDISPAGLEVLRKAGHEVVELSDAGRERLLEELASADALLVRSRTKVDAPRWGVATTFGSLRSGSAGSGGSGSKTSSAAPARLPEASAS